MSRWLLIVPIVITASACGEPGPRSGPVTGALVARAAPLDAAAPAPTSAPAPAPAPVDPDDVRPPDVALAPPPGFVETEPVVPPPPAAQGWWKRKTGCGKGRHVEKIDLRDTHHHDYNPTVAYVCRDKAGKQDGPFVGLYATGAVYEEGTNDHGVEHGVRNDYALDGRLSLSTPWVHGVIDGVVREDTGTVRTVRTYRAGTRHGLQTEDWYFSPRYKIEGYDVDGHLEGVWWTTWHDGSVLARIEYDHDEVVGSPRWWYPDGRVWSRGVVAGDTLTWTSDVGPGRYQSELVCKDGARQRFVVREHDGSGAVLHAVCTDGSCTPVKGDQDVINWADPSDCSSGSFRTVRVWPVLEHWGE